MPCPTHKSQLSSAQQSLLTILQRLNFGRIESLHVRGGQPLFTSTPRLIRELKFGGDNQPRPELVHGDFRLKSQVQELLREMAELGTGVIELIEVKHGLPFRMLLTASAA